MQTFGKLQKTSKTSKRRRSTWTHLRDFTTSPSRDSTKWLTGSVYQIYPLHWSMGVAVCDVNSLVSSVVYTCHLNTPKYIHIFIHLCYIYIHYMHLMFYIYIYSNSYIYIYTKCTWWLIIDMHYAAVFGQVPILFNFITAIFHAIQSFSPAECSELH